MSQLLIAIVLVGSLLKPAAALVSREGRPLCKQWRRHPQFTFERYAIRTCAGGATPSSSCMGRVLLALPLLICQFRVGLWRLISASDPERNTRTPPCFRSPNGALEDSFYLAAGRQLWDASFVYVPTLVLASELDFWSRTADRDKLKQDLVHAPVARVVVIPKATHFVQWSVALAKDGFR